MTKRLVGITVGMLHPHPERNLFKTKTLIYSELQLCQWLLDNQLIPIIIPPVLEHLDDFLNYVDGILLFGGDDVAPENYGETALDPHWAGDPIRDKYEFSLVQKCVERKIPLFGVCRGLQLINVVLGGSLYQDIPSQTDSPVTHRNGEIYDRNYHHIAIQTGGFLDKIYPENKQHKVNTVHHQAIKQLSDNLRADAISTEDHLIEAISHRDPQIPTFAVQWHPEWLAFDTTEDLLDPSPILLYFKDKIEAYRGAP